MSRSATKKKDTIEEIKNNSSKNSGFGKDSSKNIFQVTNIKKKTKTINKKALEQFATLIKKHDLHPDPMSLLSDFEQDEVRFTLEGTNSGFANCVRRTLINEIDCTSLTCTHGSIKTDDLFLANKTDKIIDDIATVVCNQELTAEQRKTLDEGILFVLKANKTESSINVTVSDIYYMTKSEFKKHYDLSTKAYEELTGFNDSTEKKKGGDISNKADSSSNKVGNINKVGGDINKTNGGSGDTDFIEKRKIDSDSYGSFKIPEHVKLRAYQDAEKSSIKLDFLFPIKNQIISRLIRNKTLFITDIKLAKGRGIENAGRYTLLDNVYYEPLGVKPFNMYDKPNSGNIRSMEISPSIFELGFCTRGNISIKKTMDLCCDSMAEALTKMRTEIENYTKSANKDFYETSEFKVEFSDGILKYYFKTLYLGIPTAVTRECYEIDPTINFITVGNENYEKRVGIIKINHPDTVGILTKAINNCMKYVEIMRAAFKTT